MNPRTYQAETMAEALAEVKRDLGRDAVILNTRNFRKGGLLGLGGRSLWEVTATPNGNVPRRVSRGRYVSDAEVAEKRKAETKLTVKSEPAATSAPKTKDVAAPDGLSRQVGEIRDMVQTLLSRRGRAGAPDVPTPLAECHADLLRRDVDEPIATEMIKQLGCELTKQQLADKRLLRKKLAELIEARIPVAPPASGTRKGVRPNVMAMIGPTGVGKTTTIAKLAANFKLRDNKRVGLITVDTYRIAAVDQLRTYAEIIEVPLRAILTASELHQAIQGMRDFDVILVDTAGRSQNDEARLGQLRDLLAAAEADEVHLVVAATANRACAKSTLDRFALLGANRIIVSKVDEAETFGMILGLARTKVALSYVTTGQDVPDDIAPAEAKSLAQWILGDTANAR